MTLRRDRTRRSRSATTASASTRLTGAASACAGMRQRVEEAGGELCVEADAGRRDDRAVVVLP